MSHGSISQHVREGLRKLVQKNATGEVAIMLNESSTFLEVAAAGTWLAFMMDYQGASDDEIKLTVTTFSLEALLGGEPWGLATSALRAWVENEAWGEGTLRGEIGWAPVRRTLH